MRKVLVGGLGLAVMVVALAVASVALGGQDRQDVERLEFTTDKPDKATGVKSRIDFEDPATSDEAVEKIVTKFEKGTEYDDSVPRRCKASDEELRQEGADACPARSIIGDGVIRARAFNMDGAADVTLLNNRNEVIFLSRVRDFAAPVRFVDRARVEEDERKLIVKTPDEFAVQKVRLNVLRITNSGDEYLKTPDKCPDSGHWINELNFTYRDGAKDEERVKSPCD